MIKITVELYPHGYSENIVKLGEIKIANDGTGTINKGNYKFNIDTGKKKNWKTGEVKDFPRTSKNVFYLIKRW